MNFFHPSENSLRNQMVDELKACITARFEGLNRLWWCNIWSTTSTLENRIWIYLTIIFQKKRWKCQNCNLFSSWYQDETKDHYNICILKNASSSGLSRSSSWSNGSTSASLVNLSSLKYDATKKTFLKCVIFFSSGVFIYFWMLKELFSTYKQYVKRKFFLSFVLRLIDVSGIWIVQREMYFCFVFVYEKNKQ